MVKCKEVVVLILLKKNKNYQNLLDLFSSIVMLYLNLVISNMNIRGGLLFAILMVLSRLRLKGCLDRGSILMILKVCSNWEQLTGPNMLLNKISSNLITLR